MKIDSNQMLKIFLENKKESICFLNDILKLSIADIEFVRIEHFETILEYRFSLLKIKLKYKTNEEKEIYLRSIKAGKIKESVFCFWALLCEELNKNNTKNDKKIYRKSIITQTKTEENISRIVLTLNNFNYSAEINLVELKKYFIENNEKGRWLKDLEINSEDILFIGMKNKIF